MRGSIRNVTLIRFFFSIQPKIDKRRIEIGCENVICGRRQFCNAFVPALFTLCAVVYQFRTGGAVFQPKRN